MGILQSHLSTVPQSQHGREDTDPRGILRSLWLQPKVCHRQTQRSFSSAKNSSQTTPALFPVHLSGPLDPASHLGSIGLPLVGAAKSAPAALAALAKKHFAISLPIEQQLLSISARQIDRRLKARKTQLKRRLYGRTKPGTLLKHHIPIKTDSWNVTTAGFTETDLVSHSGNSEKGEFVHSLNLTDIFSTWVEARAVMGKGQISVLDAMHDIEQSLPFKLLGIDSDNGTEFINYHLKTFCDQRQIQFTRGRPYKKDDNAHIEQKNWTHVRKILGYLRYDSPPALHAINDLYRNELGWMMNLFQPSVKLVKKTRLGSQLKRIYDQPTTPLDRLLASNCADPAKLEKLKRLRASLDPFKLSQIIEQKLDRIFKLANYRHSPAPPSANIQTDELSPVEKQTLQALSQNFGIPIYIGKRHLPKG